MEKNNKNNISIVIEDMVLTEYLNIERARAIIEKKSELLSKRQREEKISVFLHRK